jgi:hypothetical protein
MESHNGQSQQPSRAEYLEQARRQHVAVTWLLGKKEIREKISEELGDSTENLLFRSMCKSKLPVKGKSFEDERSESAISVAAKRLSRFLDRFSQQFQVLREEGIYLTIPRKVGRIQVGYYFSCFDRQLKAHLSPEDAEKVLLRAWQQWKQPWAQKDAVSFREHLYAFSDVIEDKTREFVGRKDIFDRIDRFVKANSSGYFFVKGDPGIGKSSVAASLVKKKGCAHHFNIRARGTGKADVFLRNICSQLILAYGLDYSSLSVDAAANDRFLVELLKQISSLTSEKVTLVIDALDEAESDCSRGGNLLCLPPRLPENIFIIATGRDQKYPLRIESPQDKVVIECGSDNNRRDIAVYLRRKIRSPKIRSYLRTQRLDGDSFVETMGEKSQGNFMYLHCVLFEIEQGHYRNLEFTRLPVGLQDYYEDHWRRMEMMTTLLPTAKLRLLYILSEVRNPVSRRILARYAHEDEVLVQSALDEWMQFLHPISTGAVTRYSLYHDTFRMFLNRKDIIQAARVDLDAIRKGIADEIERWIT